MALPGSISTFPDTDPDPKHCLLGYLKTRIRWGGGGVAPPSKCHVWCPNMTNNSSLESSYSLLLESAKNTNLLNWFFFKSSYAVKIFLQKNDKLWYMLYGNNCPLSMKRVNFCKLQKNPLKYFPQFFAE